jgi:arylsulfatase A-like enzyme
MRTAQNLRLLQFFFASQVFLLIVATASAQQQATEKCSPAATQTPNSKYLPPAPEKFGGVTNLNAMDSKPCWPPRVVPPKGAPNILLIMTDDVGFAGPSTFGGVIPTPALDRIANNGLRYIAFHSTALCSPTRAALITGRNHHSVGFGVISELATGFPGYDSVITKQTATIAEILKQNGYATSWFGKEHNTPAYEASQAGPFDHWPVGLGFDYFYGFVGGDTSQWQPNLFRNTTPIYPYVGNPKWNLTTAMADDAIDWMRQLNDLDPDKPFFIHYTPGGTHAPHHPTPEWIERISAMHLFDQGWNKVREQIFANQKKLGVIPQDAQLTPWPKDLLKEWDTLSPDEKKMFIRQADIYAAYLAYTDYEIGRVIQAVQDLGKLDNTIIIYISGDNGTSSEGTLLGTPNEVASFNGVKVPVEDQLKYFYDVWGSAQTYPHMAVGWAWTFDTPYKWVKQVASHFGGTRQGLAISWPGHITDVGGVRSQFHHVIDIVPTLLEVTGIPEPVMVNGVPQKPIEGVSMAYTFDKSNANVPSRHDTQYFEMFGNRALYHNGWVAATTPIKPPWDIAVEANPDAVNAFKWELYDLSKDWTESNDLAQSNPQKLKELQDLFWVEANKYQVLPLDTSTGTRMVAQRPSATAGRTDFVYTSLITGVPANSAPSVLDKSYTITAEVEIPNAGAEGMLVTQGGRFGGYGFYIVKNKPIFTWNLVDLKRVRWEASAALTPGRHTIAFDFKSDGPGLGRGGLGVLLIDGKEVARQQMDHTLPFTLQWDETFDVGMDTGTPVDDKDYQVPFRFTGKLNKVTVNLKPTGLTAEDQRTLDINSQRNNRASE